MEEQVTEITPEVSTVPILVQEDPQVIYRREQKAKYPAGKSLNKVMRERAQEFLRDQEKVTETSVKMSDSRYDITPKGWTKVAE